MERVCLCVVCVERRKREEESRKQELIGSQVLNIEPFEM